MTVRAGLTALVALVLAGCGSSGASPPVAATPASPASTATSTPSDIARPSPSASPSASVQQKDDSLGVAGRDWPTTVKAARSVLERLPKSLDGKPLSLATDEHDKNDASADYRSFASVTVSGEHVTTDTADGKPERMRAVHLMAAHFGLAYGCAKGSYRGTAPPLDEMEAMSDKSLDKPVWFSCVIDIAEGEDDFAGHGVGWTSGKTAWVLIAQDRAAAASLVTALARAAG